MSGAFWWLFAELPAPQWLSRALVPVVCRDWMVEQTRKAAQPVKDAEPPPEWADSARISGAQGRSC